MTTQAHSSGAVAHPDAATFSRRDLGKRLLGASALAVLMAATTRDEAQAAPVTDPWRLGGNAISSDGTNFLGTTSVAPLIFKTTAVAGGTPAERMRILSTGRIGIGTTAPSARLHTVTSSGTAISGRHAASSGAEPAVLGETNSIADFAVGVLGKVASTSPGVSSVGVRGINAGMAGKGAGVWGSHAGSGWGVSGTNGLGHVGGLATDQAGGYGQHSAGNEGFLGHLEAGVKGIGVGSRYGVRGTSTSSVGVSGTSTSYIGVRGSSSSFDGISGSSSSTSGVYGLTSTTNNAFGGVEGRSIGINTSGVIGQADNGAGAVGVLGKSSSGFAGYFIGKVTVQGTLTKSAGSFKIDHPLDPANQYLSHSFVESPDMKNVYDGNVTTDAQGEATVELPAYFEALNRDFRYQLTVLGQFAQAIVAHEIVDNHFSIKTDKPNVKLSWQVTGIRQDAYANAHRIPIEEDKLEPERGTYLHPTEHGRPAAAGVDYDRTQRMERARRPQPSEGDPQP